MKTISYKGYTASLEFDAENDYFFGEVLYIKDSISFDGETEIEAIDNFKMMVDEYLEYCKAIGKVPNKPSYDVQLIVSKARFSPSRVESRLSRSGYHNSSLAAVGG